MGERKSVLAIATLACATVRVNKGGWVNKERGIGTAETVYLMAMGRLALPTITNDDVRTARAALHDLSTREELGKADTRLLLDIGAALRSGAVGESDIGKVAVIAAYADNMKRREARQEKSSRLQGSTYQGTPGEFLALDIRLTIDDIIRQQPIQGFRKGDGSSYCHLRQLVKGLGDDGNAYLWAEKEGDPKYEFHHRFYEGQVIGFGGGTVKRNGHALYGGIYWTEFSANKCLITL